MHHISIFFQSICKKKTYYGSKVVSTHLWNTPLNLYQHAIVGLLSQLVRGIAWGVLQGCVVIFLEWTYSSHPDLNGLLAKKRHMSTRVKHGENYDRFFEGSGEHGYKLFSRPKIAVFFGPPKNQRFGRGNTPGYFKEISVGEILFHLGISIACLVGFGHSGQIFSIGNMGVSKNNGTPKSSTLIGCSIIFTIHFGGFPPIFGNIQILFIAQLEGFFCWMTGLLG